MTRVGLYRIGLVALPAVALELLCRGGVIDRLTMPPPSQIVDGLVRILLAGQMTGAILKTLANVTLAFVLSLLIGIAAAAAIHRVPFVRRLLDPLFATYYAIPIYAFYPLFMIVFGLGDAPQVLIAFMLAVVGVIVSTLNGLDTLPRALLRTARVYRMNPVQTALRITLPYAAPFLFTGMKLAIAYAFIGVIGAEFIMSRTGLGYEIRFAYDNLDNLVMYPLILLILLLASGINMTLDHWERLLLARRARR